jgi:glucosamine-6-phosphate deaminase
LPGFLNHFRWIGDSYEQGDLAILGLGLNGHVAFHEPELPKNFYSGCVRLSEKTCNTLGVEPSTWGITYGASAFLKSKAILMLVSGTAKREVLQRLLKKDPSLPATALCSHPQFTILADSAASGQKQD